MNFHSIKTKVLGALAIVVLLVTAAAFTGTPVNAQGRHFHHSVVVVRRPFFFGGPYYPYYWGGYYVDPVTSQREAGYQDGFSRGKSDAKKGLADNPASHKHFRNSSSITYRDAFQQGYNDGFAGQTQKGY